MENRESSDILINLESEEKAEIARKELQQMELQISQWMAEITTTVNELMDTDEKIRKNGEFRWSLLVQNNNVAGLLTLGYLETDLPNNVQNYCLVLLKQYFEDETHTPQEKSEKFEQANNFFTLYLDCAFQIPLHMSTYLMEIIAVIVNRDSNRAHLYIDNIFASFKFDSPQYIPYILDIIKEIIKNVDTTRSSNVLDVLIIHMKKLIKIIPNDNQSSAYRVPILSCISNYFKKIFPLEQSHLKEFLCYFKEHIPNYFRTLVDSVQWRSDNCGILLLIKILKLINFMFDKCFSGYMRNETLLTKLWNVFTTFRIIHQFQIHGPVTSDVILNQTLFQYLIKTTLHFYTYNCSPAELSFFKRVVVIGVDFIQIQGTQILGVNIIQPSETNLDSSDEMLFDLDEESDPTDLHPSRNDYIQLFKSEYPDIYCDVLHYLYPKLLEIVQDISGATYHWKKREAAWWIISKTATTYFLSPKTSNATFTIYNDIIIKYLTDNENTILFWQSILAYISLITVYSHQLNDDIISHVYETLSHPNILTFHVIFCCEALKRICDIIKFKHSTLVILVNYSGRLYQTITTIFVEYQFQDYVKMHLIATLSCLLRSHNSSLFVLLPLFYPFLFRLLEEHGTNYTVSDALTKAYEDVSQYAKLYLDFPNLYFLYVCHNTVEDFDSDAFAYNRSIAQISYCAFQLCGNKLDHDAVAEFFDMLSHLIEVNNRPFLHFIISITCLSIKLYPSMFIIEPEYDGRLNSNFVVILADKYTDDMKVYHPRFIQLFRAAFVRIPNFNQTSGLLAILRKIINNLQKIIMAKGDVEIPMLFMFCYFDCHLSPTLRFLSTYKGLYSKLAFSVIFGDWYRNTLNSHSFFSFFHRYSTYVMCKIFNFCIDNGNKFLENFYVFDYDRDRVHDISRAVAIMLIIVYSDIEIMTSTNIGTLFSLNENFHLG